MTVLLSNKKRISKKLKKQVDKTIKIDKHTLFSALKSEISEANKIIIDLPYANLITNIIITGWYDLKAEIYTYYKSNLKRKL